MLKDSPTKDESQEMMKEATVSAQFTHLNVVNCIGVVTSGAPLMLLLELAAKGELHGILKNASPPLDDGRCLLRTMGLRARAGLGAEAGSHCSVGQTSPRHRGRCLPARSDPLSSLCGHSRGGTAGTKLHYIHDMTCGMAYVARRRLPGPDLLFRRGVDHELPADPWP